MECGIIFFEGLAKALPKYISKSRKKSIDTNYKPSANEKTKEALTRNHMREENPKHRE